MAFSIYAAARLGELRRGTVYNMKGNRLPFYIALVIVGIIVAAASVLAQKGGQKAVSHTAGNTRQLFGRPFSVETPTCPEDEARSIAFISLETLQFQPELVQSPCALERGLSARSMVPENGMLFAFGHDSRWAFWMKDMLVSIDIVWIAADGTVVLVASDVSPDTYPQSFRPDADARYVWELPAGRARELGIAQGTLLQISLNTF